MPKPITLTVNSTVTALIPSTHLLGTLRRGGQIGGGGMARVRSLGVRGFRALGHSRHEDTGALNCLSFPSWIVRLPGFAAE